MRPIGRARMAHEATGRRHPLIDHAAAALGAGGLDRREFLRIACLLGAGVGSARALADIAAPRPAAAQTSAEASPNPDPNTPRAGGVLRCGMPIQALTDPARFAWIEMSNQLRHQNEYLTITGPDNLTRPMLAEAWAASDDLKTWTFQLRPGVRWQSGAPFDAEDVAFNVERWLDPATGSSNLGLFSALTEVIDGVPRAVEGALEIVDPLTVRFHLSSPVLSIPENLYNYPTALVRRDFTGDLLDPGEGTGPYALVESLEGEGARLVRAEADDWSYWGADLPHIGPGWVDEIRYVHFDPGSEEPVEALAAGALDLTYELDLDRMAPGVSSDLARLFVADTAQTPCMRMRVDLAPFDDVRVRRAVQLCCDPSAYPGMLFDGRGRRAEHHHVAPIHPEYYPIPRIRRDVEAAKALLAEAGYPDGIDLTLDVGNTSGQWQQRCCELLKEQAEPAGVRIAVNVIPAAEYEATWYERPFGLTQWAHRPLGTMALSLGYRSGVPWNESRYANPEFDTALTNAEALLDLSARQEAMQTVQRLLQRDAVMVQPCWRPVAFLAAKRVRGVTAHPTLYHQLNNVWLDA